MKVLLSAHTYEEEIKKSRFVAQAIPVSSARQAMEQLEKVSDLLATHNCWAYKIGQEYRFNDDGEPGGTAGRPILQAIEGQDLGNTLVVVTRYYGGIKLGTGGLARAYGGTAAKCLNACAIQEYIPYVQVRCFCSFSDRDRFLAKLSHFDGQIIDENFNQDGCLLSLSVPQQKLQEVAQWHTNIMRGQALWEVEE